MRKNTQWLLIGGAVAVGWYLWKQSQATIAAAAVASSGVSPESATSLTTTENMKALSGLGFTTPVNYALLSRPTHSGM